MTQMDALKAVRWDSAGSARWLAPNQYGETFIWTGHELKDYPKKYKETGRKRHRTWLAENGFDTEAIEADDNGELLKLSIWSWQKYADHLNHTEQVTPSAGPELARNEEQPPGPVDTLPPPVRNDELPPPSAEVVPRTERRLLPVIGFDYESVRELDDDGQSVERQEPRISSQPGTLLRCDTCFMKDKCPEMQPHSDCVYEIPVQLRTPAQFDALQGALIEIQTKRVLLMQMIEQREGGYADPNLSAEMPAADEDDLRPGRGQEHVQADRRGVRQRGQRGPYLAPVRFRRGRAPGHSQRAGADADGSRGDPRGRGG